MILCAGEALIDMVPTEMEGRTLLAPLPGGAIFNTAIALGRLGAPAGFLTGLSTDLFGQQLQETLAEANVDTSMAVRADRPTTLAFVKLTDGHAEYTFYDENTAGRMIVAEDMPPLGPAVRALYFGGISLCALPAADAYRSVCLSGAAERVVMIDPNIRPGFIDDRGAYLARLGEMMAVADIVKVSDEDLNWIIDTAADLDEKAQALRAMGPKIVIVTRGADGADAYLPDATKLTVPVPLVDVVDTVGAGDTFNAGVLAALERAGYLDKSRLARPDASVIAGALEHGVRVAAVTVSRAGADAPWAHELA